MVPKGVKASAAVSVLVVEYEEYAFAGGEVYALTGVVGAALAGAWWEVAEAGGICGGNFGCGSSVVCWDA